VKHLELTLARNQFALSLIFILGFLGIRIAIGLRMLSADSATDLTGALMMVLSFWFQRTRTQNSDATTIPVPDAPKPANPT
jgi:hypothetical protein